MEDKKRETVVQVLLTEEYVTKLDADAERDDRQRARQATFLVKAYYDGRLRWADPAAETSPSVHAAAGGAL